jgi:arsenate reductase (glutaredoxin)
VRQARGMADDVTVYFNPRCSKCRTARDLLGACEIDATYREYLVDAPDRAELERLMGLLGIDDPRQMMRTGEPVYAELGLGDAGPDELLDAVAEHPILLERPIVVRGDRAVIARPPERVHELLTP